jgi:hypothetical protein
VQEKFLGGVIAILAKSLCHENTKERKECKQGKRGKWGKGENGSSEARSKRLCLVLFEKFLAKLSVLVLSWRKSRCHPKGKLPTRRD